MTTQKIFPFAIWFTMSLAGAALSAQRTATEQDLAELHAALQNLEAELEAVEARRVDLSPDLRSRVEDIRDDAIYLKVKMQRHQEDEGSGTGILLEEVEELESDIRAVREEVRRSSPETRSGTQAVPVGTTLSIQLLDTIGTQSSEPGDRFRGTTVEPINVDGEIVVPAGATVEGVVEVVDRPSSRTDRSSRLVLAFERIDFDGESYPISATVVDASEDMETGIGDEAAKIGIGAGIGAILGAVLGGDEGAVIGGVIGGAGAILGTEGKDVFLPRGTVLDLRLDQELAVSSPSTES